MRGHWIFAAVYDLMNAPVEHRVLQPRRASLLGGLTGQILEVGAGTGVNLPYYTRATRVVTVEPDPAMRARLSAKLDQAKVPVEVCAATAEALPFAAASFDAVVFTLALCTVPDPDAALAEAGRVLGPGGRLVVLEHVRGTGRLARRQDRLAPLWSRLGAECQPNRDTRAAIERAGFAFEEVDEFAPLPRWVLTRTMLQGSATVRRGARPECTHRR